VLLFSVSPLRFLIAPFLVNAGKVGHCYCNRSIGLRCQLQV
jgi:hypothetical protein